MAITLQANTTVRGGFIQNGSSADMTGAEVLLAAQGAGTYINVEKLTISVGATAMAVTIGAGETNSAVSVTQVGPIHMSASTSRVLEFGRVVRVAANQALVADASAAGNITIIAEGFVS